MRSCDWSTGCPRAISGLTKCVCARHTGLFMCACSAVAAPGLFIYCAALCISCSALSDREQQACTRFVGTGRARFRKVIVLYCVRRVSGRSKQARGHAPPPPLPLPYCIYGRRTCCFCANLSVRNGVYRYCIVSSATIAIAKTRESPGQQRGELPTWQTLPGDRFVLPCLLFPLGLLFPAEERHTFLLASLCISRDRARFSDFGYQSLERKK